MSSQPLQEFLNAFERSNSAMCLLVSKNDLVEFLLPDLTGGMARIAVSAETAVDDILALISDCAKRGRWCRLNLATAQLDQRLYQALRSIAGTGHLQTMRSDDVSDVPLASGTKIFVVISDTLLSKITIPTFLNLFDHVYRE